MKKFIAILIAAMIFCAGCARNGESEVTKTFEGDGNLTDFSLRLFSGNVSNGKNTVFSPVSVLYVLGMTENGAQGETKAQIEKVFGADTDALNELLKSFAGSQNADTLKTADGIWINQDVKPSDEYLAAVEKYFNAEIHSDAFTDKTVDEINSFTAKNTDGMIKKIIEKLDETAEMVLVSAVCFEAKWADAIDDEDVTDGGFKTYDGRTVTAHMMNTKEDTYFETGDAAGFVKRYSGGEYEFIAILPDEGEDIVKYAQSFDAVKYAELLDGISYDYDVFAQTPEFTADYDAENLKESLETMGITDLFDSGKADLSRIGDSLYVSKIAQTAHIEVDSEGTKRAAVTHAEVEVGAMPVEKDVKEVILNRPFMYIIADTRTQTPIFIGTVLTVEG